MLVFPSFEHSIAHSRSCWGFGYLAQRARASEEFFAVLVKELGHPGAGGGR